MEQKPIISVRGLRKVYQVGDEKVVALGNINLEILQGQIRKLRVDTDGTLEEFGQTFWLNKKKVVLFVQIL